jgi:hypothetical protein
MTFARLDPQADTPQLDLETVDPAAASVIREVRAFESTTLQVWADDALSVADREAMFRALHQLARRAAAPELCFAAIARSTRLWFTGESDPWEAAHVETAVAHDYNEAVV